MRAPLLLPLLAACAACASPTLESLGASGAAERSLPAAEGWEAWALPPAGAGLTRVAALDLAEDTRSPELVALDERGRCWILARSGARWSARPGLHDPDALLALAHANVDPRTPGRETLVGGRSGNLYAFGLHAGGAIDARPIARFPGATVECILAGDLDPFRAGAELLRGIIWWERRVCVDVPDRWYEHLAR